MTPAQQTVEQLQAQAVWRRKATIGKCRSSGDDFADQELWSQSLAEADDGWLTGPFYSESEVTSKVGTGDWICTRRFPLKQPDKIRLIDDGLESGLNLGLLLLQPLGAHGHGFSCFIDAFNSQSLQG